MINEHELGIGSKVLHNGQPATIVTLNEATNAIIETAAGMSVCPYSDLYPVPLTAELMKCCGFEQTQQRDADTFRDGRWYNGFTIYESFCDGTFAFATYVRGDGEFKGGYTIASLHQLQNLYRALTGRALVIKDGRNL